MCSQSIPVKTVRESTAAEFLDVSQKTLQRWRSQGVGPPFLRLGRSVKYDLSDLSEFLRKSRMSVTPGRKAFMAEVKGG